MVAGAELVVLVDSDGTPIGSHPKADVHHASTPLHLAFSLYLFRTGPGGTPEVLMTRRALSKKTWPGVWTNTCCGHPAPGESAEVAAHRRLAEELGAPVARASARWRCVLPRFAYRATDAAGVVENELCPVFTAWVHPDTRIRANADEVLDFAWAPWSKVMTAVSAASFAFSPWAVQQIEALQTEDLPTQDVQQTDVTQIEAEGRSQPMGVIADE